MTEPVTILFVDDEPDLLESYARILDDGSYHCVTSTSSLNVLDLVREHKPAVVMTDFLMPGKDGMDILREINEAFPHIPVVMVSAHATVGGVVEAVKVGAFDYLTKPFSSDQLLITVRRAVDQYLLQKENTDLRRKLQAGYFDHYFVGKHPKFIVIEEQIRRSAATDSNVFIQGETGTGKELAARAVHLHSKRENGPFIIVDYSALSSEMMKILPYSGAEGKAPHETNVFEAANGGTLYIKQVEDLDMAMQARLLRILQSRKVYENAEWQTKQFDIRVITSTSADLQTLIAEKKFRENLYYYLNVINIVIPPLRDRKEDIGMLCDHFLRQRAEKNQTLRQVLHADALARLMAYDWPGNVRELRNAVERAASMTEERNILTKHLPENILNADQTYSLSFKDARRKYLEEFEKRYLESLILKYKGNISRASEMAGVTRMSFYRILKRVGMLKEADHVRHSAEGKSKQENSIGKKHDHETQ